MNVYMINSSYEGCCYVRIMMPAIHNGFRANKSSLVSQIDSPEQMRKNLVQADVVVFHRPETEFFYNLAKELKDDGKKIVVDNDDTFKIDDYHPLAQFKPDAVEVGLKSRGEAMDKMLGLADLVTASTSFLADEYRKINNNVIVLPNCVDPYDWPASREYSEDKVRIGIVGSAAFEYDYLHLKPLFKKLSEDDKIQLVLFGLGNKEHRKQNPNVTKAFNDEYTFWDSISKEHIPWCPIQDYPETLNAAHLDMMLIPRRENYFNKCKSNIKFLEAAMCEVPVIAQSFQDGPYEELAGEEMGILIRDNDDWEKEVMRLVRNKHMRRRMGKRAKKYVLENYDINKWASQWHSAYKELYEKNRS